MRNIYMMMGPLGHSGAEKFLLHRAMVDLHCQLDWIWKQLGGMGTYPTPDTSYYITRISNCQPAGKQSKPKQ